MPPLQPKEVGMTYLEYNNYTWLDDYSNLMMVSIYGYTFQSYENQIIYDSGSGLMDAAGTATTVWSYINYTSAESCICSYNTQVCTCGDIEGGGDTYAGYNYWAEMGMMMYLQGAPVYYYTEMDPVYGLMMVYDIEAPWPDTTYPRYLNYTLKFQNSTGYLRLYSTHGTEYCCKDTGYCVNPGVDFCDDGSPPVELYAQMDQSYQEYQLVTAWSEGFFGYYHPAFPSSMPPTTVTTTSSSSSTALTTGQLSYAIVVPIVTFILGVVSICEAV